jgi:lipopolysaccharide/colanic/teichoic acid biosynthesis glycosyltransferase
MQQVRETTGGACPGTGGLEARLWDADHADRRAAANVRVSHRYKRPLDIVLGVLLLIVSAPVFALTALLVKISSKGPVFFRQERLGKDEAPFLVFKFRTMHADVDSTPHQEYFKRYLKGETAPGADANLFKLRHDPRITPVGGMLRRLGLDELPQLLNVIRGDMSLVGPRPPLAYEVEHYTPRHRKRLLIKPGITGLWQVRGRDVVDFETMIDMDLEYIERQSLPLDLGIVIATVPALLWAFIKHR